MTGCSSRGGDVATVTITAGKSVCWSAVTGKTTQHGCGSQTFSNVASTHGIFSGHAQKTTPGPATLTLQLLLAGKLVQTSQTTAPFGTVNTVNG